MQQSKVDAVINKKIDQINAKGRGFTLDLLPDLSSELANIKSLARHLISPLMSKDIPADEVTDHAIDLLSMLSNLDAKVASARVEVKESLPPVDDYVPPSRLHAHQIDNTPSFIEYANRYGSKERSLVMCSNERVVLVINELVDLGDRELIKMPFEHSSEWRQWANLIGEPMSHTELYKALGRLSYTLMDAQILESLRTMRAKVQVSHESDIQDSGSSYGVIVKTAKGEEMKKFPKTFKAVIPVLDQDAMQDPPVEATIELRLEIDDPKEPGRPFRFTLLCPEFERAMQRRINQECQAIKDMLDGWAVVRGIHGTQPRTIGRTK